MLMLSQAHKFRFGDHIRISKYNNAFAKSYVPNWCEEVSAIIKVKNTVLWTYFISDLLCFMKSNCKK